MSEIHTKDTAQILENIREFSNRLSALFVGLSSAQPLLAPLPLQGVVALPKNCFHKTFSSDKLGGSQ